MNFIFINPNRNFSKNNIWGTINSVTPPLGLALLAGILRDQNNHVEIIDAYALNLSEYQVIRKIDSHADIVGISAMTVESDHVCSLAKRIKLHYPNIKVLLGGVHPTIFHEKLVSEGIADYVIRNEGEIAIKMLADDVPLKKIPNLTYLDKNGTIRANKDTKSFVDLDSLPLPAYDKLPMELYHSALGATKRHPSIGMVTSRGCPGQCTFCFSGMFGRKIRYMSPQNIVKQMLYLRERYSIKEISFYDDTFTSNRRRIKLLCKRLIQDDVNMTWSCFSRIDSVNPELLRLMHQAGCHQIMYGFESIDKNVLNSINKHINVEHYDKIVKWTRSALMDVRGAFMLGSPGDTEDSITRTLEYSRGLGIQFSVYNITTPFPGTAMFDWAAKNGYLIHKDWEKYDLAHAILDLPTIKGDVVQKYYDRSYRDFYFRPAYIFDRIRSLRTLDDFKMYTTAFLELIKFAFKNRYKRSQQRT